MARRTLGEDSAALAAAIQACTGRVDQATIDQGMAVVRRVDRRLAMSSDVTVVAIAGATGSGKSSLFNALTRSALAETGVQRPLTRQARAASFGAVDATPLLDWLAITPRHVMSGQGLDGLVLLDLADYDSIETSHRDEVERLIEATDAFVWVVDPQKYADALLHERYLARFAAHADVMLFVLNQVDRMDPDQVAAVRDDFARLVTADGIADPVIFEVSAVTGQGITPLRDRLKGLVAGKKSSVIRLEADVVVQARRFQALLTGGTGGTVDRAPVAALTQALTGAAGVAQVGEAVQGAWKRRGSVATGWPVVSWIAGLRPDPLKRLHLDQFVSPGQEPEPAALTRSGLTLRAVSRATADTAVRAVVADAAGRLPRSWRPTLERLMADRAATLPDSLGQAVVSTDLGLNQGRRWWSVVRFFQWLILVGVVVGLVWLGLNAMLTGWLELSAIPTAHIGGLPLPTWLVIGGVVCGVVLAILARMAVSAGAKLRAAAAVRRLTEAVERVAAEHVVQPLNDELRRYDDARTCLSLITR